jgi:hypothetical protein
MADSLAVSRLDRRGPDDTVFEFRKRGKEAEAAFRLPPNVHSYALLPIDQPMGRFGPVRRVPLADVVYEDRWGEPYRDL